MKNVDTSLLTEATQTQGYHKVIERIKGLLTNATFKRELSKLTKLKRKDDEDLSIEHKIVSFCQRYDLPWEDVIHLVAKMRIEKNYHPKVSDLTSGNMTDVCTVIDNYDEHFTGFPIREWAYDYDKHVLYKTHPISIHISRFATKRDVLRFIEKKWDQIEWMIGIYGEGKTKTRKPRKLERDSFIWENRKKSLEEISDLVQEKFGDILIYSEISKIIKKEHEKRIRSLAYYE